MEALPAEDGEPALSINRYFLEHPEMVLGRHARTGSPFGPAYTCLPHAQGDIEELLDGVLHRLPVGIQKPPAEHTATLLPEQPNVEVGTAAEGATIKEGSYVLENNALFQIIDGATVPVTVRIGKGTDGDPCQTRQDHPSSRPDPRCRPRRSARSGKQ